MALFALVPGGRVADVKPSSALNRLGEVALLFLRLGLTSFGGPAAHIAMMRGEFVNRRGWLSDQQYLDLIGASNLIPGPNSTEVAIHLGYLRAGWRGLIVAGVCFILPAMLIVIALAALYVHYGTTPAAAWLLYGIKPVVLAVIVQALWGLSKTAVKGWLTGTVGVASFGLALIGINELLLLAAGGLLVMLALNASRLRSAAASLALAGLGLPSLFVGATTPAGFTLWGLFLTFLKIGSVLYGSGYVLLAFMRADFVERLGWLSDRQLLDAIVIGQVTPGPVFTTATFVGYILAGTPGALVATLGIFLPAFVFVAISTPFLPRLRRSPWFGTLLDGINVASLGLMAAVTLQLAQAAIVDLVTALLALAAFALLVRYKINSAWLVLGGAAIGVIYRFVAG